MFYTTLSGPGTVWIQSLPFSRIAERMMAGAAQQKGEDSILKTGFDILGGD